MYKVQFAIKNCLNCKLKSCINLRGINVIWSNIKSNICVPIPLTFSREKNSREREFLAPHSFNIFSLFPFNLSSPKSENPNGRLLQIKTLLIFRRKYADGEILPSPAVIQIARFHQVLQHGHVPFFLRTTVTGA